MFFSVIVPIFNTKVEYLEKCLQMINDQICQDFECLIINDGSTEQDVITHLKQ
jgi:glycosyltransferase involved in cell wall biosynthesis